MENAQARAVAKQIANEDEFAFDWLMFTEAVVIDCDDRIDVSGGMWLANWCLLITKKMILYGFYLY